MSLWKWTYDNIVVTGNDLDNPAKEPSPQTPIEKGEVIDVFEPKLTIRSKKFYSKKRDLNFHRFYIGMIDFAGDQSCELEGINLHAEGGVLLPGPDSVEGLNISRANGGYVVQGQASEGHPYVVFDLLPDGKQQAAKVFAEKEGCEPALGEVEFQPQPLHWMFDVLESLVWAFFIAMLIRLFLFQTFFIPSGSMQPTLYKGDRIVANKMIYQMRQPRRGEVVIFKVYAYLNEDRLSEFSSKDIANAGKPSFRRDPELGDRFVIKDYIKRVAGLPGDKVEITHTTLIVNGEEVVEPWMTDPAKYGFNYEYGPVVVPEGHIFVIGDNHRNSQDSHKLGFLPLENVVGKALFVFFPPGSMKVIR